MPFPETATGYDLVTEILKVHASDPVEALLRYAGDSECDFLELKGSVHVKPEYLGRGEVPEDICWNIAHEFIAMINSRGGILLIGVDDKPPHGVIPLEDNDPRNLIATKGLDAYKLQFVGDRLLPKKQKWIYKKTGYGIDVNLDDYLELIDLPYQGHTIIAYLVKPLGSGEPLILVQTTYADGRDGPENLPYRKKGAIGQCNDYVKSQHKEAYRAHREVESPTLAQKIAELRQETSSAREDADIAGKISRYLGTLRKSLKDGLARFVPLDAESDADSLADSMASNENPVDGLDYDEEDLDEEDELPEPPEAPGTVPAAAPPGGEHLACPSAKQVLRDVLDSEPRLALVGEPGAGKTTSLKNFAVQRMSASNALFFFVPLGQWSRGGSITALITRTTGLSLAQIDSLVRAKRLHLVLDALNECPDEFKPAARQAIIVFAQEYPECHIVVSARKFDEVRPFHFPAYSVSPLQKEQQVRFLKLRLKSPGSAERFLQSLLAHPGGEVIAANPLLLDMAADVEGDGEGSLSGRAALHRRWMRKWFSRERKKAAKAGTRLPFGKEEDVTDFLAQIALIGRMQGYRDIPVDVVQDILDEVRGNLDSLLQGPLLVRGEDDLFHFKHETFQEYLCAEALLKAPGALDNLPVGSRGTWGMPLAYARELIGPTPLPAPLQRQVAIYVPWLAVLLHASRQGMEPAVLQPPLRQRIFPFLAKFLHEGPPAEPAPAESREDKRLALAAELISFYESALAGGVDATSIVEVVKSHWYDRQDAALCYTLRTDAAFSEIWRAFEARVFRRIFAIDFEATQTPKDVQVVRNRFFTSALEFKFRDAARLGVDTAGFLRAAASDFKLVCRVIATGFISPEDIPEELARKIEQQKSRLSAAQLLQYRRSDLITQDEFQRRVKPLVGGVDVRTGIELLAEGVVTEAEVSVNQAEWERQAMLDAGTARLMVKRGLLGGRDLLQLFRSTQAIPSSSWTFHAIESGILERKDFIPLVQPLLSMHAQPSPDEIEFAFFVRQKDVRARLPGWIAGLPPRAWRQLLQAGIAAPQDILPYAARFLSPGFIPPPEDLSLFHLVAPRETERFLATHFPELSADDRRSVFYLGLVDRGMTASARPESAAAGTEDPEEILTALNALLVDAGFPHSTRIPRTAPPGTTYRALVVKATDRYALVLLPDRRTTAICLPSRLPEMLPTVGDLWNVSLDLGEKGFSVRTAELVRPSPWDGRLFSVHGAFSHETSNCTYLHADALHAPVLAVSTSLARRPGAENSRYVLSVLPCFRREHRRFRYSVVDWRLASETEPSDPVTRRPEG